MFRYRICKTFTVESGHMLSKHPEECRYPHGHTRQIEVVVSSETLDSNDMVMDFKALKLAVSDYIQRLDHSMAVNSEDPLLESIRAVHPESLIVFEGVDPTTEVLARDLFDFASSVLPCGVVLERVRVWETPSCWAEFGI